MTMDIETFINSFNLELKRLGLEECKVIESYEKHMHDIVRVKYIGRDPSGHAETYDKWLNVVADKDINHTTIEEALKTQRKARDRVSGCPPVVPSPFMTVDHLKISYPLAARLRLDYETSEERKRVLASGVYSFIKTGRVKSCNNINYAGEYPNPLSIAINQNLADHREKLDDKTYFKGTHLVVSNTILPDQIISACVGKPITAIAQHAILADDMTVTRAYSLATSRRNKNSGTTVFETDGGWISAKDL